jgi:hypothetical protein
VALFLLPETSSVDTLDRFAIDAALATSSDVLERLGLPFELLELVDAPDEILAVDGLGDGPELSFFEFFGLFPNAIFFLNFFSVF